MSSKSLGTLTLDLIAKIDGWASGMDKADRATADFQRKTAKRRREIEASFKGMGAGIAAGFATIGGGALLMRFIEETKQAQAEQAQLAAVLQSTGNAAGYSQQRLNEMADAFAKTSNFDSGEITTGITRMLSYAGVAGETLPKAMQATIDMATRLGMEVSQASELVGKALDVPSQGMTALTKQGFKFTDAQKEMAKELEQTGRKAEAQAIILGEMGFAYDGAAAAARDTLGGALADLQKSFKDAITGDDDSAQAMKEAVQELADTMRSDGVKQGFAAITSGLVNVATKAAEGIAFLNNFGVALGQTIGKWVAGSDDPAQRLRDKAAELEKEAARLNSNKVVPVLGRVFGDGDKRALAAMKEAVALRQQAFEFERDFKAKLPDPVTVDLSPDMPVAPQSPTGTTDKGGKKGGANDAAALARAEFKSYLDEIKRQTATMLDVLDERQTRLDMQQEQGLLSIAAFYSEKTAIEQQALAAKLQGVDAEIAAQQKFIASAGKDTDRLGAQSKLNDLYDERNKLQRQGALEMEKLGVAEAKAMKDLQRDAEDVRIRLMEMNGQLGEAARLRANMGSADQIAKFELNGMPDAADNLRKINEMEAAQGRLNELKREFGLINDQLGRAEGLINAERQAGTISEIESMGKAGVARRQAIAQLEEQLALYMAMNAASSSPEVIAAIQQMQVELAGLKAVAEPLAAQFQDMFKGSFEDAFSSLISGSKNAKDAFKDMADSIVQQISRMAAQNIASGLFGAGGIGGGLGSLISGMFGYAVGSSYIANDQVAMLHQGERVLTAKENREFTAGGGMGGGQIVNNNFTITGEATRQTQQQIASAAALGLARAQRRNG